MISIISLLLDNIFNNSLFTLVSLIYLKKDKYYLLKCALLGLIYDLFFTDIIILHFTLFLLLGLFINFLNKHIKNKIFISIIIITIYQILLLILSIANYYLAPIFSLYMSPYIISFSNNEFEESDSLKDEDKLYSSFVETV